MDAAGYFAAVHDALVVAQHCVYIADWWMSPELYLKRPAEQHLSSQLVDVLGTLADRGVQVYVFLYKEISFSLTIDSLHTKRSLLARSSKINVLRHPNFGLRGGVFLWSHHEKMVIVDGAQAFLGGLDLCYGRYDTPTHRLCDIEEPHTWNNIDYSNVRVSDFVNVAEWWQSSLIDRAKVPRMP